MPALLAPTSLTLAHALPPSVGAVPLTLILTVLLALFLAVNAVGTRRIAARAADPAGEQPAALLGEEPHPSPGRTGIAVGLALAIITLVLDLWGTPDPSNNITDTVVLQLGWGAIAITSMLAGPWWRRVNPTSAVSLGLGALAGGVEDRPLPGRTATVATAVLMLGWAAVQLLVNLTPAGFAILLLVWLVGHALLTGVLGRRWLDVEPTNAMSSVLGMLRPGGGGPLSRLTAVATTPTLTWVAAILIGWSLTDLLLETEWWHDLALPSDTASWVGLEMLVGSSVLVAVLIRAASRRAGLAPAMVPVAAGWVVSHYLSLLLIEGQGIFIWLSDPFSSGADLLGMTGQVVNPEPVPVGVLTALQMVPFLLGHLAGVVVAQRRAVARGAAPRQVGPATVEIRALIAVLLLGGTWLQLAGL